MRHILLAATALVMLSGMAYAQTSQSNSGSNATVNTASGSQSQSISNPKVNVIGNPIGNGASSSNSGAKATSNTRSAARSAAVGNTTNVTVSGYAGVDGSGNAGGSSAGTAAARTAAPAAAPAPRAPRAATSTTAAATPCGTRRRSSRQAWWAAIHVRSAHRAAFPCLASASHWVAHGQTRRANVVSSRRCCSTWARTRLPSN